MKIACFSAVLLLSVSLAGCAPRTVIPAVDPDTSDAVASAAAHSLRDYATGLADAAESTAVAIDAGTLDSAAAVFDSAAAANKAARDAAFAPFAAALNAAAPPAGEFDAARTAKAFRGAAAGFREAAK